MTESQVLERIEGKRLNDADYYGKVVDPNKLAALLAEMSDRIEKLENRPVDCVSRSVGVVGTPNITPVVELSNVPDGIHFNVTSKSYGPGEKPSQ